MFYRLMHISHKYTHVQNGAPITAFTVHSNTCIIKIIAHHFKYDQIIQQAKQLEEEHQVLCKIDQLLAEVKGRINSDIRNITFENAYLKNVIDIFNGEVKAEMKEQNGSQKEIFKLYVKRYSSQESNKSWCSTPTKDISKDNGGKKSMSVSDDTFKRINRRKKLREGI